MAIHLHVLLAGPLIRSYWNRDIFELTTASRSQQMTKWLQITLYKGIGVSQLLFYNRNKMNEEFAKR